MPSGNGVGKSYLLAGLALWAITCHPGSKAVIAAPTQDQLKGVVWAEMEEAFASARKNGLPLGGKLKGLSYDLGENWRLEGFGSGSVESRSGRHAGELYAFIDEMSGVHSDVLEAIDSLNPSTVVGFGNPLRPDGKFYDLATNSAGNKHVRVIKIPSTDSPHITLPRSPFGLADATWLEDMRAQYGEESIWWLAHVMAEFPGANDDTLIPRQWLDLAMATLHTPGGPRRIAVDLAKGTGGDNSVIIVRDDNGVLHIEYSNRWELGETARRVAVLAERFNVEPHRISFDAANLGTDFGNRLAGVGLTGCREYLGGSTGNAKFKLLRSAAAWQARRRLDPKREVPQKVTPTAAAGRKPTLADQFAVARATKEAAERAARGELITPERQPLYQFGFSIRPDHMKFLRPELQAIRYQLVGDTIELENKDETAKRLRHSPDFADTFFQLFAFPNT